MTNREYFKQKKEAFFDKLSNWFVKYLIYIYLSFLVLDVLLFVCVWKVNCMFLGLFIPWTFYCFVFTWIMVDEWLDKEHKESE